MRRKLAKHYYFVLPGTFYPGDIYARNEKEARENLRNLMGRKRLPTGTDVWQSDYQGKWDVEFAFLRWR